jgi:hypothetical protein
MYVNTNTVGHLGEDVWDSSLRVVPHPLPRQIDTLMNDFQHDIFLKNALSSVCVGGIGRDVLYHRTLFGWKVGRVLRVLSEGARCDGMATCDAQSLR